MNKDQPNIIESIKIEYSKQITGALNAMHVYTVGVNDVERILVTKPTKNASENAVDSYDFNLRATNIVSIMNSKYEYITVHLHIKDYVRIMNIFPTYCHNREDRVYAEVTITYIDGSKITFGGLNDGSAFMALDVHMSSVGKE